MNFSSYESRQFKIFEAARKSLQQIQEARKERERWKSARAKDELQNEPNPLPEPDAPQNEPNIPSFSEYLASVPLAPPY